MEEQKEDPSFLGEQRMIMIEEQMYSIHAWRRHAHICQNMSELLCIRQTIYQSKSLYLQSLFSFTNDSTKCHNNI